MCGVFLGDVSGIVPGGYLAFDMHVSRHVSAAERPGIMYPARGKPGRPPPGIHFTLGHRVGGAGLYPYLFRRTATWNNVSRQVEAKYPPWDTFRTRASCRWVCDAGQLSTWY